MKKCFLLLLLCTAGLISQADNGLEGIIVEKYYISNGNDTTVDLDGGVLPVGSVTYRIYVDMLPGYKFQAAFGIPGQPMKIETSTSFFNNEDRGDIVPSYTKTEASNNSVMLDSWLSVGSACLNHYGIMKQDDNAVGNVVNIDGVLQNNDSYAGLPLTSRDGLIFLADTPLVDTPEVVTRVNIDNEELVFANINEYGSVFETSNGSWASLNGAVGPTSDNKVLIAQITTNGVFTFELNIQIGTPGGGTQQYVAINPTGSQILLPGLKYYNDPAVTDLNIKSFIQGFYIGGGLMNAAIDPFLYPEACDTLSLELASSTSPYSILATKKAILDINGNAKFDFPRTASLYNQNYYLVLKHRNSIQTWSASPVLFDPGMIYDFTDNANKAYGMNLFDLGDGNYAVYNGDVSDPSFGLGFQDGVIESQDYADMETAVNNILSGYVYEDITGDGIVESADYALMETNVNFIISSYVP